MIDDLYLRFYKVLRLRFLSVILAYLARFLFFLRFLLRRSMLKPGSVEMQEETALEILKSTSPDPNGSPDYSTADLDESLDLSVIVPVYNHIDVLKRCIDSLVVQQTSYAYELILVDDGSTDGAQKLIEQYAPLRNVRVIHQKNGGIAAARNTGLCLARGRYLMFVDCDDYVHEDIVEKMMRKAGETGADIVMCAHNLVKRKGAAVVSVLPNIYSQWNLTGYPKGSEIMNFPGLPWGKVYKRELFEKVRYFPGYWYEDNIIHGLIFPQCKRFVYLPEILYEYQWHECNFSHVQNGKKQSKGVDSYWLLKRILDRYTELGFKQDARFYLMLLRHLSAYFYTTVSSLPDDVVQAMFVAGRELLLRYQPKEKVRLPYMLRLTEMSILNKDIALWKLCSVNQ